MVEYGNWNCTLAEARERAVASGEKEGRFERQRQREREREGTRRIERQSDKERRRKRESDERVEAGDDQYAISLNYNNNGDQTKLSALL